MIESRNQTSHAYNEETADEIADSILSRYLASFEEFFQRFTKLEQEER